MPDETPTPQPEPVPAYWRDQETPEQCERRLARRRRRRAAWLVAFGVLFASGFVAVLFWLRPTPRPVPVALWFGGEAPGRAATPPFADADRTAFLGEPFFEAVGEPPAAPVGRARLLQELDRLDGLRGHDSVVLALAGPAHAEAADVLLEFPPADAPLSLRELLGRLAACPVPHKLLVLELAWPATDVRRGEALDGVAAALPGVMAAVPDAGRLTLCACSPGQTALASEDLGRTVLGHYLEEGLRGWADGYGPGGARDGRVTVRELAAFVTARADRWARRNRTTRQTPVLLGDADRGDFVLTVLPKRRPQPPRDLPEPAAYPDWLRNVWAEHDRWLLDGRARPAPRLLGQFEALLLQAEQDWRNGRDPVAVRSGLDRGLARLAERLPLLGAVPRPSEPPSLALAVGPGQRPDPATVEALRQVFARLTPLAGTRDEKPEQALARLADLDKLRARPHADLALAALELLAADPPPAERVRFVNTLLQSQEPRPRFAETLLVQRLAELADQPAGLPWPAEQARSAVELARTAEAVAADADPYPALAARLADSAQKRHDAEAVLFARGYASAAEADARLRQALASYSAIRSSAEVLRLGQATLDEALAVLPLTAHYCERDTRTAQAWTDTARAADALARQLHPPSGDPEDDAVQRRTEALRRLLDDLRRPFAADAVAKLIARCGQRDAAAAVLAEVEAVLATPFVEATQRVTLFQGGRDLARRLNQAAVAEDRGEDAAGQATPTATVSDDQRAKLEREERLLALRRARMSCELLRLGGVQSDEWERLDQALDKALATPPRRDADLLAVVNETVSALRSLWAQQVPELLTGGAPAADRLARLAGPFAFADLLDDPAHNPTARRRSRDAARLWQWCAGRAVYEGRDPTDPATPAAGAEFYARAARLYAAAADGPAAAVPDLQLTAPAAETVLTPARPAETVGLGLRLTAPAAPPGVTVEFLRADDDWLAALDPLAPVLVPLAEQVVPVPLRLQPTGRARVAPPPLGVLAEARVDGYSFHRRLPVALTAVSEGLELLVSTGSREAARSLGRELLLRPLGTPQAFTLFVRNPTARERNVDVILKRAGSDAVWAGAAVRKLAPGEVRPLAFAPPGSAPPPAAPTTPPATPAPPLQVPDLAGELRLIVDDVDLPLAKRERPLDDRLIRVEVARPRSYSEVTGIRFTPAAGAAKNRLDVGVRAAVPVGPPACLVDLVVPAGRNPGLAPPTDGNFRGPLPADGRPLALYAQDVRLAPDADENGLVYLTVDGSERAYVFRTTFARLGGPTTPVELTEPALRLRAAEVAAVGAELPVVVEVDNAPPDAALEVRLGRDGPGGFETEASARRESARERRLGFTPFGPGGVWVFEAAVRDWRVPLDTRQVLGRRKLVACLVGPDGRPVHTADGRPVCDTIEITLDNRPPEGVRLDVAAKARKDAPLPVRAVGRPPASGIREAVFFVGRPTPEGQVPANALKAAGRPVDEARTTWAAELPLTGAVSGQTEISVLLVSAVGQGAPDTKTVELLDAAELARPQPGKITGRAVRGGLAQAGLKVTLQTDDAKAEVKKEATTAADGGFEMADVPPGRYVLSATKPYPSLLGTRKVELQAGQTLPVTLEMSITGR